MIINIVVEKLENGYYVKVNKRKLICKNELQIARLIVAEVSDTPYGKNVQYSPEHLKKMHDSRILMGKKTIGLFMKSICEIIQRDNYSTLDRLTDEIYSVGGFKTDRPHLKARIKNILWKLARKGFVRRANKNSKKYHLTDKRPEGYVESGRMKVMSEAGADKYG